MSNTLEHSYTRTKWDGTRQIVTNAEVAGLDNPLVGEAFLEFLEDNTDVEDAYAAAYLLTEYGGEALDDLEDLTEDDLREHVVALEAAMSDEAEENLDDALNIDGGDSS